MQIDGMSAFVELARRAGVRCVVHIGVYYYHVVSDLVETKAYVRGRNLADEGVCSLAAGDFKVSALNSPSIFAPPSCTIYM